MRSKTGNKKVIVLVHLITGLGQGGAEAMLYKLLKNMDQEKFSNIVISMSDEGFYGEKIKKLNIPVYCLNIKNQKLKSPFSIVYYLKIIKKVKPDIIQAWMYHANFFSLIFSFIFKNIKYVNNIRLSLHDINKQKLMTRFIISANAKLSPYSDVIINNSINSIQQHIDFGFSEKNHLHVPNGFGEEFFSVDLNFRLKFMEKYKIKKVEKIIGLFARYHEQKNHIGFLSVADILVKEKEVEWRFVLAGTDCDIQNSELKKTIESFNLSEKVILLGSIDTSKYFSCLDIHLLTSRTEGFPNVIGEAMASGVPCVATDVGDCKKIIDRYGYVASIDDYALLSKYCKMALNFSEKNKEEMRNHILKNYSIKAITEQYERIYEGLI